MDIILLETTVAKAVDVLEPLQEVSQLRRMSREDVRAAARTIMEQRTSRLAAREDETTRRPSTPLLNLEDVDLSEERKDVLVPTPREDNVDSVIDNLKK